MRAHVLLAAVSCLIGCAQAPPSAQPQLVERSRLSMGSALTLSAWTTNERDADVAFEHVFREFDCLEALLSVWKDGSDVVRLNKSAGMAPVHVSAETIEVLELAHDASVQTNGKFDITFGALADIWKFDHDQDNTVPDRSAIEKRLPLVNYEEVVTDHAAGTAFIRKPGMRVHLGGIGKGYAVDRAVALLKQQKLTDFMIQSGGDLVRRPAPTAASHGSLVLPIRAAHTTCSPRWSSATARSARQAITSDRS